MSDDRYARVYFDRIARDPKFDGIRDNRSLMGSWLLLLIEAEKAWPSPAFPLPTSWVPVRDFRTLTEAGVLDVLPDHRYRMHGLDAIRAERSKRGADAAAARWGNAERNASGNAFASATSNATRAGALTLTSSSSSPEGGPGGTGLQHLTPEVCAAWEGATGRSVLASGHFAGEYLDDACRRHPSSEVEAAIIKALQRFDRIPAPQPLIVAVRAILDPLPDHKATAALERQSTEADASTRRVLATLKQNHALGGHREKRHPRCPLCQESAA